MFVGTVNMNDKISLVWIPLSRVIFVGYRGSPPCDNNIPPPQASLIERLPGLTV